MADNSYNTQPEGRGLFFSGRSRSRQMLENARIQAEEIVNAAKRQAESIVREAESEAAGIMRRAEHEASEIRRSAKEDEDRRLAEIEERAVRCVADCLDELRSQQRSAIERLDGQWLQFLKSFRLTGPETGAAPDRAELRKPEPEKTQPDPQPQPQENAEAVSREDIAQKVSAIATQLAELEDEQE